MPLPAGTGLTRRSFVSRATGLALSVYGAASLGPRAFEQGIAAAAAQAPASDPVLVSDLPLGRRRLADAARADERPSAVREPAPDARAAGRPGHAARGGPDAALPPVARRHRGAVRRGQGHGDAGDRLRRRQPVALHLAALLGGGRGEPVRPLGLARALPRPARHAGQPAPGAHARLGPPAGAGRPRRAGGDRGRAGQLRLLDAGRVGRRRRQGDGRVRRPGRAVHERRGPGTGARRVRRDRAAARPARALPGRVHDARRRDLSDRRPRGTAARAGRDDRRRSAAEGRRASSPAATTRTRTSSTACRATCSRSGTACARSSATSRRGGSRTA